MTLYLLITMIIFQGYSGRNCCPTRTIKFVCKESVVCQSSNYICESCSHLIKIDNCNRNLTWKESSQSAQFIT